MKLKFLNIFFIQLLYPAISFAQPDTIVNRYKKEFDAFKENIQSVHQRFKDKNDSIFIQFLKDSWSSFNVFYKTREVTPKPVVQPSLPELPPPADKFPLRNKNEKKQSDSLISPANAEIIPVLKEPPEKTGSTGIFQLSFDFYGEEKSFSCPPLKLPEFPSVKPESISGFFEQISSIPELPGILSSLNDQRKQTRLNDWGYLKLVQAAARAFSTQSPEQKLLIWAILLKSGYNVKIGYSANQLYLLVPYDQEIYNSWYIDQDGATYYMLPDDDNAGSLPAITVYKADYPGNRRLSLSLKELPLLGKLPYDREFIFQDEKFKVTVNRKLIDFFNEYPFCGLKVYFGCPMSDESRHSLETFFYPLFNGKSDSEKVEILLRFLQRSFSYRTDKEQYGRERYLFPDETLFYPYSDCEDRAILFSRLVKHFTGLGCIGLNFPGHVSAAIRFPDEMNGARIKFSNVNYMICDPTYLNAGIGRLPAEYEDIQPEIIIFE